MYTRGNSGFRWLRQHFSQRALKMNFDFDAMIAYYMPILMMALKIGEGTMCWLTIYLRFSLMLTAIMSSNREGSIMAFDTAGVLGEYQINENTRAFLDKQLGGRKGYMSLSDISRRSPVKNSAIIHLAREVYRSLLDASGELAEIGKMSMKKIQMTAMGLDGIYNDEYDEADTDEESVMSEALPVKGQTTASTSTASKRLKLKAVEPQRSEVEKVHQYYKQTFIPLLYRSSVTTAMNTLQEEDEEEEEENFEEGEDDSEDDIEENAVSVGSVKVATEKTGSQIIAEFSKELEKIDGAAESASSSYKSSSFFQAGREEIKYPGTILLDMLKAPNRADWLLKLLQIEARAPGLFGQLQCNQIEIFKEIFKLIKFQGEHGDGILILETLLNHPYRKYFKLTERQRRALLQRAIRQDSRKLFDTLLKSQEVSLNQYWDGRGVTTFQLLLLECSPEGSKLLDHVIDRYGFRVDGNLVVKYFPHPVFEEEADDARELEYWTQASNQIPSRLPNFRPDNTLAITKNWSTAMLAFASGNRKAIQFLVHEKNADTSGLIPIMKFLKNEHEMFFLIQQNLDKFENTHRPEVIQPYRQFNRLLTTIDA